MHETNGVRPGQRVRDADGRKLGKVTDLYEQGFAIAKGFAPFRRETVARWDEVRGVRDGEVVLARSDDDLDALAEGGLPASWRIPVPPHYPRAATPAEAQAVFEEVASGAIGAAAPEPWPAPLPRPEPAEDGGHHGAEQHGVDDVGEVPSPRAVVPEECDPPARGAVK